MLTGPLCRPPPRMWLSASAFFHNINRVYSPIAFGKKWDPSGNLIRHYVPELARFPERYIYEPWKCPIADQKKAGCLIGTDYPKRMLDENLAKDHCLERLKIAFGRHLKGDSEEAMQGKDLNGGKAAERTPQSPGKRKSPEKGSIESALMVQGRPKRAR